MQANLVEVQQLYHLLERLDELFLPVWLQSTCTMMELMAASHSTRATSCGMMHMLTMRTVSHKELGFSTGTSLCVMDWLTTLGVSMTRSLLITLLTHCSRSAAQQSILSSV